MKDLKKIADHLKEIIEDERDYDIRICDRSIDIFPSEKNIYGTVQNIPRIVDLARAYGMFVLASPYITTKEKFVVVVSLI